jgi:hypothetical protein
VKPTRGAHARNATACCSRNERRLETFFRATGELIGATARVGVGFENVICSALGGAPA